MDGMTRDHHVWRSVFGKLRAKHEPLTGEDAFNLLDRALSGRTGIRCHPIRMTLRQSEQHKRQHNENPRKERALFCFPMHRSADHSCNAHTKSHRDVQTQLLAVARRGRVDQQNDEEDNGSPSQKLAVGS